MSLFTLTRHIEMRIIKASLGNVQCPKTSKMSSNKKAQKARNVNTPQSRPSAVQPLQNNEMALILNTEIRPHCFFIAFSRKFVAAACRTVELQEAVLFLVVVLPHSP